MGYIKEPDGINFVVDPTPLTKTERNKVSEIIAFYNATGKKMPTIKSLSKTHLKSLNKKRVYA